MADTLTSLFLVGFSSHHRSAATVDMDIEFLDGEGNPVTTPDDCVEVIFSGDAFAAGDAMVVSRDDFVELAHHVAAMFTK